MIVHGDFAGRVFSFIENTYGSDLLEKVKSTSNQSVVDRIITSSMNNDYTDERTGNKIIAMLRLNP